MDVSVEMLAKEFSEALKSKMTGDEMREIVRRNRAETHPRICHTHDFCDTNMVLLEIFKKYGMDIADEGGTVRWGHLWDDAWNRAKAAEFWL